MCWSLSFWYTVKYRHRKDPVPIFLLPSYCLMKSCWTFGWACDLETDEHRLPDSRSQFKRTTHKTNALIMDLATSNSWPWDSDEIFWYPLLSALMFEFHRLKWPLQHPKSGPKPQFGDGNYLRLQLDTRDFLQRFNFATTSSSPTKDQQRGDVHFAESAWTYPVVIGLAKAGPLEVAFAVLLLLVNLCPMARGDRCLRDVTCCLNQSWFEVIWSIYFQVGG